MSVSTPDTIWSLASRLVAVACVAGVASSCGAPADKFAPACPSLSLLRDAADITRFRPGGQDVTDMVLDGKLTDVPAKCGPGEKGKVKATLNVVMQLTRGPAAPDRTAQVTFFVAVTDGDRVLDEQDYPFRAAFPANTDTAPFTSDDIVLELPVNKDKSAAAYRIYVGYRLTPAELAYNRRRGPR